MTSQLLSYLNYYLPEVFCVMLMCILLLLESSYKKDSDSRSLVYFTTYFFLSCALVCLFYNLKEAPVKIFSNAVVIDPFSSLIKIMMVVGTMATTHLSRSSKDIYVGLKSEFIIMSVGVLIGGMLLASSNNLLTLYMGIETLSILAYVMSALKRDESTSAEAGMKYALYGGLTAGIMLFGMSHIYGIVGSLQFENIITVLPTLSGGALVAMMFSFLLLFVGIGYKISCFPFHMWSPDIYQGAPIPVTSFFAIVPKFAGLAVLMRISLVFFGDNSILSVSWIGLLHIVAAITMSVGNISAIGQDSVKRLLAFSSIGHVGFMLLGVLVLNEEGITSLLFYGMAYLFMTLVAFYIVSYVSDNSGTDSQSVFKGLVYKNPVMAVVLAIALFSLAGMPPFSGFVAKFNILSVVVEKKLYSIAMVALINSVIGMYYYLKLAKNLFFTLPETEGKIEGFSYANQAVIVVLCIPIVFMGIFWSKFHILASGAKLFFK